MSTLPHVAEIPRSVGWAERFVSVVKIAAQVLPGTAMLSQWLDEIETGRLKARLDRLEDPLAKYGPRARDLMKELYSFIRAQDHPTTGIPWTPALDPFRKELRYLEAAGFLTGRHSVTAEFARGLRLTNSGFIIDLALLFDDPTKSVRLNEIVEGSEKEPQRFRTEGFNWTTIDRGQRVFSSIRTTGARHYFKHDR